MGFQTVPEVLLHRVSATPNNTAYSYPAGSGWKTVSWKEFGEQVKQIAMGLKALGLTPEQRVAILAGTRYEWIACDMGILCAAGATTTIYPSSLAEDCSYIVSDSDSVFAFAENDEQVKKLMSVKAQMPGLKKVIVIDGKASGDGFVITLQELQELGKPSSQADYEATAKQAKNDGIATLIYTSGTTGKPKGVILTHDCWVYEGEGINEMKLLVPEDVQFLWLPLAHSFGKVLEVAQIVIGFHTAVDGRVDKLVENLGQVKPTFVAAVPRIFEKVYNKVVEGTKKTGGLKWSIFKWSIEVGKEVSKLRQAGQEPSGLLAMKNGVAQKLVFSKLQERFGGRLRYFVSGSAPLSREMAEFFHACNILILEGYGLTESSAASFVNRPTGFKFGTVGPPLPGTTLKIESDGEILIKGRGIMRGYHNKPEETAATLKDGWLYTGDIGELDEAGRLKITDRKKDLIKTSGGKYCAPQNLENALKTSPIVSNSMVHGDMRPYLTVLIAVNEETAKKLLAEKGVTVGSVAELVKRPEIIAEVKSAIDAVNATQPPYSTMKKFHLVPQDFSQETGELTPTLKVKRKVVTARYKAALDALYEGAKD